MMRTVVAILAAGTTSMACGPAANSAVSQCALHTISPGAVSADGLTLAIDQPDDPARPTAWQGPIHATRAGGKGCTLDIPDGIIAAPFLYDGESRLFFSTYSGSNQQAQLLDIDKCQIVWRSAAFAAGTIASPKPSPVAGRGSQLAARRDVHADRQMTARFFSAIASLNSAITKPL